MEHKVLRHKEHPTASQFYLVKTELCLQMSDYKTRLQGLSLFSRMLCTCLSKYMKSDLPLLVLPSLWVKGGSRGAAGTGMGVPLTVQVIVFGLVSDCGRGHAPMFDCMGMMVIVRWGASVSSAFCLVIVSIREAPQLWGQCLCAPENGQPAGLTTSPMSVSLRPIQRRP